MEMTTDIGTAYEQAIAQAERVMAGIGPDQLDAATPCRLWTTRELVNHFVGSCHLMAAVGSGKSMGEGIGGTEAVATMGDVIGDDPTTAYASASASALQAFTAPGALERPWRLPFAEVPGAVALNIHFIETLAHTWDLAKVTGQLDQLDPALAETGTVVARGIVQPQFRNEQGDPFGPEVSVAADAPAYDRLAGILGRTP